jgi:hypothetical protein
MGEDGPNDRACPHGGNGFLYVVQGPYLGHLTVKVEIALVNVRHYRRKITVEVDRTIEAPDDTPVTQQVVHDERGPGPGGRNAD